MQHLMPANKLPMAAETKNLSTILLPWSAQISVRNIHRGRHQLQYLSLCEAVLRIIRLWSANYTINRIRPKQHGEKTK